MLSAYEVIRDSRSDNEAVTSAVGALLYWHIPARVVANALAAYLRNQP